MLSGITHLSPKGSEIARTAPKAGGGSSIASQGDGVLGGQDSDLFSPELWT